MSLVTGRIKYITKLTDKYTNQYMATYPVRHKQKTRYMNKLWKKFIYGTALIMAFTLILSLVVNSKIVGKYYLRSQKHYIQDIGSQLITLFESGTTPENAVRILEEQEKVLVVYSSNTSDSEALSNELREQFRQKGLGFQKFWLWEQDYQDAVEHGMKLRLYQQEKLKYGILAEYMFTDKGMFAIAAVVPNTEETVGILNQFLIILLSISSVVAVVLMYILVRHITNPCKEMEEFSRRISGQDYGSRLVIHTNDELETVADSMNRMSQSIKEYQDMLLGKNRQMEALLDNVAHDLKTPISLIGTYATGMQDGLDDGTFLDTIIRQNAKMARLTEQLMGLSRIGQKKYSEETIALDRLLQDQVEEQRISAVQRNLGISTSIEPDRYIRGNAELISTIFSNLLSNAIKYAAESGPGIEIRLYGNDAGCHFTISNQLQAGNLDLDRIWEPFYVGESSRNQNLSGTGLGLPIVKKIAEQCGYGINCTAEDGRIKITVIF